jgi:hypothetical protein
MPAPTRRRRAATRTSPGRPQWLTEFAKENHVTLTELRRISKLLATKRQAERGLAEIKANMNARAATATVNKA